MLASLGALAGGCANGSGAGDAELQGTPVVALPEPAAHGGSAEATVIDHLRQSNHRDFGVTIPFAKVGCRKNAFCDDFEEATPGARWTSSIATQGTIDFVGPSSSLGAHALRATTSGSGGAAYLTLAGPSVGQNWVGSLAFSMRVEAMPSTVIGGPELAVIDGNGATTRIGFSVRPEGVAVHQYFESCSGPACTSRSDIVADVKPGEWRRLTVALETSGSAAPPYGRIEVTVDGGEILLLPLAVTPFDGNAEVHAGITVGDTTPATARIDDVVFFTH